ncbi:helix-turn-helix domain-containing protein [Pseudomonas sp. 17053703]|uniref:helix-turn-helix domain-containing protein n=1 Tax=Pseudomonas sp. 17053703 TaxID=2952238 RepID=UPI002157E2D5|nr:helix-turn-helix domain-containing protein [Pseudomonas sp. 17053703]
MVSTLARPQTQWFHVFRAMIDQGDIARMGPHAFAIYAVIKSHTNITSGIAFPSIELISEKSGVSLAQVKRELRVLENAGYVMRQRVGRSNRYTLRERIHISDENGLTQAIASWDYVPAGVQQAVADLKNLLIAGDLDGGRIVHIERLNLQINLGGENTQINLDTAALMSGLERLPAKLRKKLMSRLQLDEVIHSSD